MRFDMAVSLSVLGFKKKKKKKTPTATQLFSKLASKLM